jgi:hypothetical protein
MSTSKSGYEMSPPRTKADCDILFNYRMQLDQKDNELIEVEKEITIVQHLTDVAAEKEMTMIEDLRAVKEKLQYLQGMKNSFLNQLAR